MEKAIAHSEFNEIVSEAKRSGSLKDAFLEHGITDVENLFPEVQYVNKEPNLVGRDTSWVTDALSRVRHVPFSRVKTRYANITEDEARAKGYVKGKQKVEEVFSALKRSTDPTTIYKLQKMDRDDIIDITDFDVIAWIKNEMRTMLNEEIARAIFIGDGRSLTDNDHINENNVRPILTDDPVYAVHKVLEKTDSQSDDDFTKNFIKEVVKSRKDYKGSGNPVLYTTEDMLTNMLLLEDEYGISLYQSQEALATALRVSKIVAVPVFDNIGHEDGVFSYELLGIMVNLADYTIGADKGGQVSLFDDFDIDYNKQSYLIETRCSGALTIPYSAVTFEKKVDYTVRVTAVKMITSDNITLYDYNDTSHLVFMARVEPDNATNKEIKWSSSDESKAIIDRLGWSTPKSAGDVVITATSVDNPDAKATSHAHVLSKPSTVTINKTSTSIAKGSTEKLTATVKPDDAYQEVFWHTENPAVATVGYSSGVVTAVSAGKVNIVGYAYAHSLTFATCEVTVTEPVVHPTGIKLGNTPDNSSMTLGDTFQFTASLEPDDATDKELVWSSDQESIITISDTGLATAKSGGYANVSVRPHDDTICKESKSVGVLVIVPTTSITLNKTGTVNANTGDTLQLTATVKPDNATNKDVRWSSSDPTIADLSSSADVSSSCLVSFKKAGTVIISAVSASDSHIVVKVTFNVTDAQVMP
nr:MAG TPA: major capsid protein [Caudoviricetes sp.]